MTRGRIEAFSDGVMAIIITIMVLELTPPHDASLESLVELGPIFIAYVLSFINVGIYWNNHHHLFQAVRAVDGSVLLANLFLLFWLSLFPFCTAWMGENAFASAPVALYGVVLLLAAMAYFLLVRRLIPIQPEGTHLREAIGNDLKGKISPVLYAVAIPVAFVLPLVAFGMYVLVAVLWFLPDRRIERTLAPTTD